MNLKTIALGAVLIVFLGETAYVINDVGYIGFFESIGTSSATMLMFLDLCIALGLATIWMVGDARERDHSVVPWIVATLLLGVAGPLGYLIRREAGARNLRESAASRRMGREAA